MRTIKIYLRTKAITQLSEILGGGRWELKDPVPKQLLERDLQQTARTIYHAGMGDKYKVSFHWEDGDDWMPGMWVEAIVEPGFNEMESIMLTARLEMNILAFFMKKRPVRALCHTTPDFVKRRR